MLSSGRGIGGVVVRGIEPTIPSCKANGRRYMSRRQPGQSRARLHAGRHRRRAPVPTGRDGDRQSSGAEAQGETRRRGSRHRADRSARTDRLSTKAGQFVVGAIFDSGMAFLDANMVFMDLMRAQEFFGRPGKVDGIDVHLTNLDATDQVTNTLRAELFVRNFACATGCEYNESAAAGFAMLKRVYAMVLMLLIGVAAFNLIATLIMVVMEKRKDIAVLMAMGATPSEIRRVFVLKGLIVGGAGTAAGLLFGAIGCCRARALSLHPHPARNLWDLDGADRGGSAEFRWVAMASMVLCLLATIYPARQASREMPVEIFRS